MRILLTLIAAFSIQTAVLAQTSIFPYEPSAEHPFGLPNPEAPAQISDFSPLIGECACKSVSRRADQTWADTVDMIWRFKYIMNGMAVQDETLKSDGLHAGSIRQFIADSNRWFVHYYSSGSPSTALPAWEGGKTDEATLILYRDQIAPNGMEGKYKITFSDMTSEGFNWLGEWVTPDESIKYPTWKIFCKKRSFAGETETQEIQRCIKQFSKAYVAADYEALANCYSEDGMILPPGADILTGRRAIQDRFTPKNGSTTTKHVVTPLSITVLVRYAHDYGYYEGSTANADGTVNHWKGKYVIVWKKYGSDWKIYLDIWNRINS